MKTRYELWWCDDLNHADFPMQVQVADLDTLKSERDFLVKRYKGLQFNCMLWKIQTCNGKDWWSALS
jgi:hypothetical protein